MDSTELRSALEKLRLDLAAAARVDPDSRKLLGEIMGDIHRLTEDRATAAAPPEGIADRLELSAVRFEADHPALAATTRRLVNLLGNVGL